MLAFLDSPIQLLVGAIVILVVFGPQKLPEIAGQLGRALRELKRTTSELQDSLSIDTNRYDDHYTPTNYDSYGNPAHYSESYNSETSSVSESDVAHQALAPATHTEPDPTHGDFAASALSDAGADYGVGTTAPDTYTATPAAPVATPELTARPAEGAVPRMS